MRNILVFLTLVIGLSAADAALARGRYHYELRGGPVWEDRVGPGIYGTIGGNGCGKDFCKKDWDARFWGSYGSTVGFYYRFIPNFVLLGEFHFGYMNTHNKRLSDDTGFLFQSTVAGEFHAPILNWFGIYGGFGIGYAYLGTWADNPTDPHLDKFHTALHGINFEFRTGCDFYPFERVPNLGFGPFMRVGVPLWLKMCHEGPGQPIDGCIGTAELKKDRLPVLYHVGAAVKYGF